MAEDFTTTEAGEGVTYWRAQLERSKNVWDVKEPVREELRTYTSEYELSHMLFPDDTGSDAPRIEQADIFILPRFVDRIKAMGGDEKPEVRFPRDMVGVDPRDPNREVTMAAAGDIKDRLAMRAMAQAGAPEEYEDALGAVCVDGITAVWWEMTGLPSQQDEFEARKSASQIVQEAAAGQHEPNRLQDHAELGLAMMQAANSDAEAAQRQFAASSPGESPVERVSVAGAEHLDAFEAETRSVPLYWRDGKFRLKCTRYDYGDWFRFDSTVTKHRDIRWMARLLAYDLDEAREMPAWRESVREKLTVEPFADGEEENRPIKTESRTGKPTENTAADDGRVLVWHILDKKHGREYFLPLHGDEFLADRPAPNIGPDGRSILDPVGAYQGFFPVSLCWGKLPTKSDAQKLLAVPLAMPGLKGQKRLNKLVSYWMHAVKQASTAYHFIDGELFDEHAEDFERNEGGVYPSHNGLNPKDHPPMTVIGWKPPPVELFQSINDAKFSLLQDLDFPIAEFTSQAIAKTATQEDIAQQSGTRSAFDIIRHVEVSYAISAHIAMSMVRAHFAPEEIDALIGPVDRQKLQEIESITGNIVELPEVDFSPKSRSRNLARSKLLLDLHERAKAEVDPMTGTPTVDTTDLVNEAFKSAGLGKPKKYELSEENRVALIKAQLQMQQEERAAQASKQPGQAAAGGKTLDSQGKPRGRRERAGRTGSRGRSRGNRPGADEGAAAVASRTK